MSVFRFFKNSSLIPGPMQILSSHLTQSFAAAEENSIDAMPMPERAKAMAVKSPALEVFPGVFASYGIEVVYYIKCGNRAVLVDTGFVHTFPAHLENFRNLGLSLDIIDAVLVCHIHVDHAAALADAKRILQAPVITHKNNVPIFESGDRIASAAYVPFIGWDLPFQATTIDYPVEDGDTIEVGSTTFKVVHLPGHTPGCTCYHFGDNYLITGDIFLQGGILGWNDAHWGSNLHDIIESMQRLKEIRPSYCLPTHGTPWEYDDSTSDAAISRAQEMLAPFSSTAGGIAFTFRAPKAEPGREPNVIKPRNSKGK